MHDVEDLVGSALVHHWVVDKGMLDKPITNQSVCYTEVFKEGTNVISPATLIAIVIHRLCN